MKIVTVLRSGGDFAPEHVQMLHKQVMRWAPKDTEFLCLSDELVPGIKVHRLDHNLPGWWAKMEIFRSDIEGDILYMDLDTIVCGPIVDFLAPRSFTALHDARSTQQFGGGLMSIPEKGRREIWEDWSINPQGYMRKFDWPQGRVDQEFLQPYYPNFQCWEKELPGQAARIESRCDADIPQGARILVFWGKPRPWHHRRFRRFYQ